VANLTVSYVSQTPAGLSAGPSAAAAPAGNPLGFLTALIDQLLAGGAQTTTPGNSAEAGANATVPGLLNFDFGGKTEITQGPVGLASSLLASLNSRLDADAASPDLQATIDALTAALDASATPAPATVSPTIDPAQINQLLTDLDLMAPVTTKETQAAIATQVSTPVDIATLRERLTALAQSVAATAPELAQKLTTLAARLDSVATDPALAAQLGLGIETTTDSDALTIAHIIRSLLGHAEAPAADADTAEPTEQVPPQTQAQDDLLRVLATLGLSTTTSSSVDATAGTEVTAAATTVPTPLLRLSNQLTQVASALAPTDPELAKKLETVATRLVSGDADANLLGKLTSAAAQPDGTSLDKLVRSLIEAKPAPAPAAVPAAPQIAAPKELTIPAPIAPKQSKSAVTEVKAAPPEPAPVTADSAPRPAPAVTLEAKAQEAAPDPAQPKVEAKVAAVVAEAAKPDPATQQPTPPQQPAPAAAQQARPLPAAYQPVANPINMGQVAFEMVRQVHQGTSRFTIRLDPPELGRVDVKMHVDNTGTVNARLTVDRAETLDLFQRDRQQLERALSQAGLDTSKTNLEFNLRQQSHNPFAGMMGGDHRQQHPGYGSAPRFGLAGDEAASLPAVTLYRGTASAGGVNIFA
jgi:flagellar hook-length control protein FliK